MDLAHTKTADESCAFFGVDPNVGLTDDQIKKNLEKYGPNGKLKKIYIYIIYIHTSLRKKVLNFYNDYIENNSKFISTLHDVCEKNNFDF